MLNLFRIKKSSRGFTLIELLVVISIIGVLASIVLASLANARRKSRDARRITDIKQIQLALELYFDGVGNSTYPQAVAPDTDCANRQGLNVLSTNGYISIVPEDPLRGGAPGQRCYAYATPPSSASTRTTYHIGASFEDTANPALDSDRDCNSTTGISNNCPVAAAYEQGFNGLESTNNACKGTDSRFRCYDLVP